MQDKSIHRDRAIKLALIAVMAATIEGGKLALAFLPNVEIVSLLCAVYGFVFGWSGMAATYIFVFIECFIWGVNTWVLTYVIYWPLLTFVFVLLGKFDVKNRFVATLTAVTMTIFFGVLSSLVDTGLLTGFYERFWYRFSIIYVRGITFYLVQIFCNLFTFLILFRPIVDRIDNLCPERFKSVKIRKLRKSGQRLKKNYECSEGETPYSFNSDTENSVKGSDDTSDADKDKNSDYEHRDTGSD